MIIHQKGNVLTWEVPLPPITGQHPLQFNTSFDETKALVLETLVQWFPKRASVEIEFVTVEACVVIKNQDLLIAVDNPYFRRLFNGGVSAAGRGAEVFPMKKTAALSRGTDQLLCDGACSVEFYHIGSDCNGNLYSLQTYKRRLEEFQDPNFHILEISRPVELLDTATETPEKPLLELLRIFHKLDEIDQSICRADAQGATTKEIAASVGLTSRSIENRRKRMFELFNVHRPMELIRITIRLEEHGLLAD